MRLWFAGLITYSEALTLAGVYVPFTDIGGAVLRMLAATRDITISDADAAELTERFATMPPHPEVPAALRRLRDHGFRLFTLTDNTLEISGRQLERAGVIDVFERRFSVDETVRRHKPAPEAYHSVAAACPEAVAEDHPGPAAGDVVDADVCHPRDDLGRRGRRLVIAVTSAPAAVSVTPPARRRPLCGGQGLGGPR